MPAAPRMVKSARKGNLQGFAVLPHFREHKPTDPRRYATAVATPPPPLLSGNNSIRRALPRHSPLSKGKEGEGEILRRFHAVAEPSRDCHTTLPGSKHT